MNKGKNSMVSVIP